MGQVRIHQLSSNPSEKSRFRKYWPLITVLALIKFILAYILQDRTYEPHRDEFLYMIEAHHMAWGYLEVPPMMSGLAWLAERMGGTFFWIKFWPSIFGSITYLLVARLIVMFGGRAFALLLGFFPFIFGYYLHVHFMFQPNFLEVFFWTWMGYGLISYCHTGRVSGLYIFGIAFGLGMMSKYSVSFFGISLLFGLAVTSARIVFTSRHFYFALAIGLIIFLPNFFWQFEHGFPIVYHMRELRRQQLQNISQAGFLKDQLLYNLPCIYTWVAGFYRTLFAPAGRRFRFVGIAVAAALGILLLAQGKSYYGMGAYPLLFAFGACQIEAWTQSKYRWVRIPAIAFIALAGCFIDSVALPMLPPGKLANYYATNGLFRKMGFLRWEDQADHPLPQDYADMLSWREMTAKVASVYKSLDSTERKYTALDTDNYGEAGAVNFYGPEFGLPPANGTAANFLLWISPTLYQANRVILVTDYKEIMNSKFVHGFQSAAIRDSISNPLAREFRTYILLLERPSNSFRLSWQADHQSQRKKTSIFE
ncbi:MAG TPA: glycosyltransferase family 39 protein [Puia sp.]|nr:glycosyltransferase family 39 protein [Puia sp.]